MKKNVNTMVEESMINKLKVIAEKSSLSYPDIVRLALHHYILTYEKGNGKIKPEELLQIQMFK